MTRTPARILAVVACACVLAVCALAGGAPAPSTPQPSQPALSTVPADLQSVFQQAATSSPCGLAWTLLAAVASTESRFDPTAVSDAGAEGLFQFDPAAFADYAEPVPAGGATPATPFDPVDAAYAAGRYLCALGVVETSTPALVAYNCGNPRPACPSAGYAEQVLATAVGYTTPGGDEPTAVQGAGGPTDRLRRRRITRLVGLVG
jgi:soluble lytic murein transglycosylase-like protein